MRLMYPFSQWNFIKISLLIILLASSFAWMFWDYNSIIYGSVISLLFLLLFLRKQFMFQHSKSTIISIFLLIIVELYTVKGGNFFTFSGILLGASPIIFVLMLKDHYKVELFDYFTSALAFILLVSMFFWILFLIDVPLPKYYVNFNKNQYQFDNYFFFLIHYKDLTISIPRFSSIFLEPGHLGIIATFILYANRFNYKSFKIIIILIATILTFSLAAYVLLLFSFSAYLIVYKQKDKAVRYLIIWVLLFGFIYYFFENYSHGNNVVNKLIIERLHIEESDFFKNARFSKSMNLYFENFLPSYDLFLGIGSKEYLAMNFGPNAGYKVFFVQHGLIGVLILLLLYLSFIKGYFNRYVFLFLIVYTLSFLQRSYALWHAQLLIFITALPTLKIENEKKMF